MDAFCPRPLSMPPFDLPHGAAYRLTFARIGRRSAFGSRACPPAGGARSNQLVDVVWLSMGVLLRLPRPSAHGLLLLLRRIRRRPAHTRCQRRGVRHAPPALVRHSMAAPACLR